jgi:hypothetical protein
MQPDEYRRWEHTCVRQSRDALWLAAVPLALMLTSGVVAASRRRASATSLH